MPIRFRCQACRKTLSTAKRKAGTTVTCPGCGAEVQVPTAVALDPKVERLLATAGGPPEAELPPLPDAPDPEPVPESPPPLPPLPRPPVARRATPAPPPSPARLNDLPLFEREDFAQMLDEDVESKLEKDPLPLPPEPQQTYPPDTILITRGTATLVMVAVVVLLGLAFAAGFLVGGWG